MKFYSTENKAPKVSFKEALLSGLAPDRGLYMPERIDPLSESVFEQNSFQKMCFETAKIIINGEIPDNELSDIVHNALNFDVPIKHLHDNIHILELFHGPTAAFKDFGARFMARTMSYFIRKTNEKVTILVATSGDTGSAVAKGFLGVPNIDVVLLYPKNKVSFLQEKQLTTLGENITALEVRGTFDDCQKMVKDAFMDDELKNKIKLSSANSINIGRLFPQSFYYIWAFLQITKSRDDKVIFCTPSGNFGNLTAGLIAKRMGLPVECFIAATNINDVVPEYLDTGLFNPRPSKETFSNAMDVGDPSNFSRMLALYGSKEKMEKDVLGFKVTDNETLETIKKVYNDHGYILDPHGAVGYKAIKDFLNDKGQKSIPIILLETAHPAKFNSTIKKAIGKELEIPGVLKEALEKDKNTVEINNDFKSLKSYLLGR